MKIALYNITTTTKFGGIETFNWEMAKALTLKGHTAHIYGAKGEFTREFPPGIPTFIYPHIKRERVPNLGTRFRKFVERLSFGVFTIRDLIKRDYDWIYVHKPYDIPTACLAARFSGCGTIFGSGGTEFFPGYTRLVKNVDHFFSCSKFNASQIKDYCGVAPKVLPNGVNTDLFQPSEPDMELRSELGLTGSGKVIISACRLVGWKGIKYSIKAVKKLITKNPDIQYIILGDGPEKTGLQELTKGLGIGDHVKFLGSVENSRLPGYYSISDIAVFPSIANETFGISIAEALACGAPVVSTRVGGIPEVVVDGSGILVAPRNEEALAKGIQTLIENDDLRKSHGKKGREWVVKNFSWEVIAKQFEGYINENF